MKTLLTLMLLATFLAASAAADVIVDQPYDGSSADRTSMDFTDYPSFSLFQFDDFTTTGDWLVATLTIPGAEHGDPFENVEVVGQIWSDLPEDPACDTSGQVVMSVQGAEDPGTGTLIFDFGEQLLPAGNYWLSAYVVRVFSFHGAWGWYSTTPINGSEAYYYNPGGSLGYGTCPIPGSDRYGEVRDMAFTLEGAPAAECAGDVDGDGDTDQSDLGVLLADWGCTGDDCVADLDGDGETGQSDLGILLADWGCGS